MDELTDPAELRDGRLIFLVNGEERDITGEVSETECFHYEYTDAEGSVHYWLVGLNSPELEGFGYAEFIRDTGGDWLGGYSVGTELGLDGRGPA